MDGILDGLGQVLDPVRFLDVPRAHELACQRR
jgi:hypothetical protein